MSHLANYFLTLLCVFCYARPGLPYKEVNSKQRQALTLLREAVLLCGREPCDLSLLDEIGAIMVNCGDLPGSSLLLERVPPSRHHQLSSYIAAKVCLIAETRNVGEANRFFNTIDWSGVLEAKCHVHYQIIVSLGAQYKTAILIQWLHCSRDDFWRLDTARGAVDLYFEAALRVWSLRNDPATRVILDYIKLMIDRRPARGCLSESDQALLRTLEVLYDSAGVYNDSIECVLNEIDREGLSGSEELATVAEAVAIRISPELGLRITKSLPTHVFFCQAHDRALVNICRLLIKRMEFGWAKRVAAEIVIVDTRDCEIRNVALGWAQFGMVDSAVSCAFDANGPDRQAQILLEIATTCFYRRDISYGHALINTLNSNPTESQRQFYLGRFRYDTYATWGLGISSQPCLNLSDLAFGQLAAEDLCLAAVHCEVAMNGALPISNAMRFAEWNVRRVARLQASHGDLAGALAWVRRLSPLQRVQASIGIAQAVFLDRNVRN